MWLLDANMPAKLSVLLEEFNIEVATAQSQGWGALSNSELVEAAASAGFSCLLTRDRLFAESASHTLKGVPRFSVVVVKLPQLRERPFLEAFRTAWNKNPILPVPGRMVTWPYSPA